MGDIDKEQGSPLESLCDTIANMVSWANGNTKDQLNFWDNFDLDFFRSCFSRTNQPNFLANNLLAQLFHRLTGMPGSVRKFIPNHSRATIVALPCNENGMQLSHHSDSYPHVLILCGDPKDEHGLASGLGDCRPIPILQIFPPEIIEQCSFIVNYGQKKGSNADDVNYLMTEINRIYPELRQLIIGNSQVDK